MIDTTSASGTLIFHVFSAIAEYERGTNHERTMAGIAAAQRTGTRFGRPASISAAQWEQARRSMKTDPSPTVTEIATLLGVSRQAIYRCLEAGRAALMLAAVS
jgi:DNA invertase Pin-like site-specific DNA recombinase